jgi:DNA (cytosine-5)-methyltransferase 1
MKILNLYAGIGGNRKLWGDEHQITAVENNPQIAKIYSDNFPKDKVIVTDAHQYLLEHFEEYDFIWASPPCPTHSRVRFMGTKAPHPTCGTIIPKVYPDMRLYQEIIFLSNYFEGKFVVENVIGYYEPLVKPQEVGNHYFWSNFIIGKFRCGSRKHNATIEELQEFKGFDLSDVDLDHRKDVILRNCIEPGLGLHIFNEAYKTKQEKVGNFFPTENIIAINQNQKTIG